MIYPRDTQQYLKTRATAFAVECGLQLRDDMKRQCGLTNAEYFLACAKAYYRGRADTLNEIAASKGKIRIRIPYRFLISSWLAAGVAGYLLASYLYKGSP